MKDKGNIEAYFVGRTTRKFCSGSEKVRNASSHLACSQTLYFLFYRPIHMRGFAPGACSRLILNGLYTQGVILRELAPCYGTHEGANERNLVWEHELRVPKELWVEIKPNLIG